MAMNGVLRIPKSSSIAGTSPSDCLESYLGHSLGGIPTPLQRSSRCILQPQLTGQPEKGIAPFLRTRCSCFWKGAFGGGRLPYLPPAAARAGYDTRSILKRSLKGLNSEFSLSLNSCPTKAEEPSLLYYLPIAGEGIIGFIPFPRVLVLCEMQSVSSRIWTRRCRLQ